MTQVRLEEILSKENISNEEALLLYKNKYIFI